MNREPIRNPGKGKRTPAVWGRWLTDKLGGLQRQILAALNSRHRPDRGRSVMYQGTADPAKVARRRARNRVARRTRVRQSMARRGKR